MRLYLVCDNEDTAAGLRLAGVEGVLVENAAAAEENILRVSQDPDVGMILVNRSLMAECADFVHEFRKTHSLPLVTEIPDTSGKKNSDSIARFVREAVGIRE